MLKTSALPRHFAKTLSILLGVSACLGAPCRSWAEDPPQERCSHPDALAGVSEHPLKTDEDGQCKEAPCEYRRYAMLCMANAYPGLESEELIGNVFDPIMHAIAPGIERVNTFSDMRDHLLLWVPNVGGGYNISKHLSLFLQLGYGAGPVRTKDSAPSIFLLPLHLDFEMRRSAFTITPGLDYFPFGMVEQRDYHGLMDRLRAIRPMLGVRVPWTHAGYKARVNLGLGPVDKLVNVKLGNTWDIWSTNVNLGFDMPLTRRNQLNFNLGRSFFFGHDSDFGSTVFSITWKYLF
jgi:hypothetical protein